MSENEGGISPIKRLYIWTLGISVFFFVVAMTGMLVYASHKVVIISEDEVVADDDTKPDKVQSRWTVELSDNGTDCIEIPIEKNEYFVDEDYLNNQVNIIIPAQKDSFYLAHKPTGVSGAVKKADSFFDGDCVCYTFTVSGICSIEHEIRNGIVYVSFSDFYKKKPIVLVDPGHGGISNGSIVGSLYEKNVTLAIAKEIQQQCADKAYEVVLTRTYDRYLGTDDRVNLIEKYDPDYYIEIQLETDIDDVAAFGMYAVYNSVYYRNGLENVFFADNILKGAALSAKDKALGLREATDDDIILKLLDIPATSLVAGHISSQEEAQLLSSSAYISKIAGGIIDALDEMVK